MKMFQVSDELYGQLKRFVVDPFDDTPEVVIGRLLDIADKARSRWSRFDACESEAQDAVQDMPVREQPTPEAQETEVIL